MPNVFVVSAILIFLAASFRVGFFYYVVYFFLLTGLLARLWIWRAWRSLEIRRDFDEHVFLGETRGYFDASLSPEQVITNWEAIVDRTGYEDVGLASHIANFQRTIPGWPHAAAAATVAPLPATGRRSDAPAPT